MPLFTRKKDKAKKNAASAANGLGQQKPKWEDSWLRTRVDPEEVAELLHGCTTEMKSRALDIPFLLLPFRPSSDPSAAKSFVRNYFFPPGDRKKLTGESLMRELRMTEVMVLIAVMKWCWARLPGGVVTWEAYHGFKVGEADSQYARDAFNTFIPISVESKARVTIIRDFFDLMTSLAAHGKSNGLGGYKLSRYCGWWAFEHYDTGKGFEAGYKLWSNAADATCHLFFAYMRSQTPEPGSTNGVLELPRSLQHLVDSTDYPPTHGLLVNDTTKVVMIVDIVSPTPFALLRRAKNFEYRDDDALLQRFAEYEDPVSALTEECRRVLRAISSTNQSHVSDAKTSTSLVDPSWSRFEDIGFSSTFDEAEDDTLFARNRSPNPQGLNTISRSAVVDLNRPTTPSWADFLSTGFTDENGNKAPSSILLPPDKALPPIATVPRGQSSQSHRRDLDNGSHLEPGELASINRINLDDSFWWVWISSLAGEEPTSRKAAFGRCALIETIISTGQWVVMEEQVKGSAPDPTQGGYVAERKSFFSFTKRGRLTRRRSGLKKSPLSADANKGVDSASRVTLDSDRHAKIQKAAAELSRRNKLMQAEANGTRRGRPDDERSTKTTSVFTLGPLIKDEASPALQWAKQYDKKAIREQYLGNELAGKGSSDFLSLPNTGLGIKKSSSSLSVNKELPDAPSKTTSAANSTSKVDLTTDQKPSQPVTVVESAPLPADPKPGTSRSVGVAAEVPLPTEPVSSKELPKKAESPISPRNEQNNTGKPSSEFSDLISKRKGVGTGPAPAIKPSGIKRLFGTMRKNKDDPTPEQDPAIAAARRALEGKPAKPGDKSESPPLSPSHFSKLRPAKANNAASTAQPTKLSEVVEMDLNTEAKSVPLQQHTTNGDHQTRDDPSPPITRRDEEFDNLSRVDTHEREQADKEFSRFDQGPLTDQPAFVPEDSPDKTNGEFADDSAHHFEPPHRPQHQSVYSAMTMHTEATDEEDQDQPETELTQQISPQDRWAQIRKNAADRAARASEEHTRSRTETRTTDDGETSGEETIESRVARIKARVAELTGNMENTRR